MMRERVVEALLREVMECEHVLELAVTQDGLEVLQLRAPLLLIM